MKPTNPLRTRRRQGIATLWVIIMLPAAMILVCLVAEIGNLWLARQELEDAMEAAALAAVKHYALGNTVAASTIVGEDYAEANAVNGAAVAAADVTLTFGAITSGGTPPHTFTAGATPNCTPPVMVGDPPIQPHGVRATATVDVSSVCANLFGLTTGPFSVTADATAMDNCTGGTDPELIRAP